MHRAQPGWSLAVVTALLVAPGGCAGPGGGAPAADDTGTAPVDTGAVVSDSASDARAETADVDHDGDGYPASVDCNDEDPAVHPGATEICNGVDDDCNGLVDEPGAVGETTYYADDDADGYGNAKSSRAACVRPSAYVSIATDCDDTSPEVSPVAVERCGNGLDDNCNGAIDEPGAEGSTTYYPDVDGDGYGGATGAISTCTKPVGYFVTAADCDDDNPDVHPSAAEWCNGIDDDCNGSIDEASAVDAQLYFQDKDGDGYGAAGATLRACLPPTGYASGFDDCNDADAAIHPGAADLPDVASADSNCDSIDGDVTKAIFVSADTGNDANSGLGAYAAGALTVAPVRTLARAVTLATAASPKRYVFVAGSASTTPLVYDTGSSGLDFKDVSLYGGYVSDALWARTGTRASALVTSSGSPTLAYRASLATTLDRLTIQGADLSAVSAVAKPSIALAILGSGLTVSDVKVVAGSGSKGAAGAEGAWGSAGCTRCAGGAGSNHTSCGATPTSGSAGAQCPDAGGANGLGGAGAAGGATSCRCLCAPGPPGDGVDGGNGGDGQPGVSGGGGYCLGSDCSLDASGTLAGPMLWSPSVPLAATIGGYGGGGGGGGGGGDYQWCCAWCDGGAYSNVTLSGGNGFTGGSGGCPGKAGATGTAGGASIGVLVGTTTGLTFSKVDVTRGNGGDGGSGGNGGVGAAGLATGFNYGAWSNIKYQPLCDAVSAFNAGHGGHGGTGGSGGGGGGGAGGDGGPSIGVALTTGLSLPSGIAVETKIVPSKTHGGAGGTGGAHGSTSAAAGGNGQSGRAGLVVDVLAF